MNFQNPKESSWFDSLNDFRRLKRGQKVFLGEKSDARKCDSLEPAEILHNLPSQWHTRYPNGYIQLHMNGKRVNYDIARNGIEGRKVYIFPYSPEFENLYLEKNATNEKLLEHAQKLVAEGQKRQKDGNWYGAAIKYKEAIELNQSDAFAHSLLGFALLKLGYYQEAIETLSRGISFTSNHWLLGRMYDARGLARSLMGSRNDARDDFKEALNHCPRNPRILTHAGILEEQAGEFETAYTYVLRALRYNPTYRPALCLKERLEESGQVKPLDVNFGGLAA